MGDRNMMTIWLVIFTERIKYKPSLLYHQTLCQGRVSKAKKSAGMIQAGNKQELVAGGWSNHAWPAGVSGSWRCATGIAQQLTRV